MKYKIITATLLIIGLLPAYTYSYSESSDLVWWDIRNIENYVNKYEDPGIPENTHLDNRKKLDIALSKKKSLYLCRGQFPDYREIDKIECRTIIRKTGSECDEFLINFHNNSSIQLPVNNESYGLYQLVSIIKSSNIAENHSGIFYPKIIFAHYKDGNPERIDNPSLILKDKGLEITPEKASRYIGTIQISHREYDMLVTYNGKPLPGCKIKIKTENKWQKELLSDNNGKFTAVPLEARNKKHSFEKYLYAARHTDKGTVHTATLQMIVDPPWPEYRSYEGILLAWAINITGIIILIALFKYFINRKKDKMSKSIFTKNKRWE